MPRSVASTACVLVPLVLITLAAAAEQGKWMGWYFKDFDPASGGCWDFENSVRTFVGSTQGTHLSALVHCAVGSTTLVTTDDYKLARNIW